MPTRRTFLTQGTKAAAALAATSPLATFLDGCTPHTSTPHPLPASFHDVSGPRSLKAHAQRHGLVFGSAVIVRDLQNDADFSELIREQCGIVVPTNELKMVALRPAVDKYDYSRGDFLLSFAETNHMLMRGHNLCWHASLPAWVRAPENSAHARQILVDHIANVCKHYAGKFYSWDVVNEAIQASDKQPAGLRKSFWYDQIGPDYVELAFRTARAADPNTRLTYNDYGIESEADDDAEKRRLVLAMVTDFVKRKVPIDAVGIQSHIHASKTNQFGKGLADFIESIRGLGLEVYLTELDVNDEDLEMDDPVQRDAIVAQTYSDFLQVALANSAVKQVLTWDFSDRFTWLGGGRRHKHPDRLVRALPFDRDYRPKEAFFAIRDSFDHRKRN